MTKKYKLVLIGDSAFAEVAYEYFTWDSEYEVVAFAVERAFRKRDDFQGLPVVDFEELPNSIRPPTIISLHPSDTDPVTASVRASIKPPKRWATHPPPTSATAHPSGATSNWASTVSSSKTTSCSHA